MAYRNILSRAHTPASLLLLNIMTIYARISTKNPENEGFLHYIQTIIRQRSALKNYIAGGFSSVTHLLDRESYSVQFNQSTRSYCLSTDVSLVSIEENGTVIPLTESDLWNSLVI